jgi:hypothetical protein
MRNKLSPIVERKLKESGLSMEEILRNALGIKPEGFTTSDGKYFPEGTVFIAWYKNRPLAAIVESGAIKTENKSYTSLSAAAAHYTGRPTTNGWDFWSVKTPGKNEFLPISKAA